MGVMMLVALTLERYVAVCHPEQSRALQGAGKARAAVALIPILTLLAHSPHLLRFTLVQCTMPNGKHFDFPTPRLHNIK
jgi:neurotensin receptor 1